MCGDKVLIGLSSMEDVVGTIFVLLVVPHERGVGCAGGEDSMEIGSGRCNHVLRHLLT